MPPTLAPIDGLDIYSGDDEYYIIEEATFCTISNSLPGTEKTTPYTSSA
jgi:hypothetical protein